MFGYEREVTISSLVNVRYCSLEFGMVKSGTEFSTIALNV